ncbi:MAG: hypothetical protein ABI120_22030 [Gemmatimonadaceae bacterium]
MTGACTDGTTTPQQQAGAGITVAVSQATQQLAVNQPSLSAITIGRLKGYTGAVALSVDSLPAGVTAAFDPALLEGAATTSILTLVTVDSALAKTTLIKIKASGVNVNTDSVSVNVTVVKGALTLMSGTAAVSVPQGVSGSVPLSITRTNGFLGAVTLFAEGLPANVTATFSPGLLPTAQTVSTLSLSALSGAEIGTSTITIRAKSSGKPDQTLPLQFTVTPSSAVGFSVAGAPATFSLVAGTAAQGTLTVTRTGGFTGTVQMSLTGAPAGVTAVLTPSSTVPSVVNLALTSTAAAVPGNYMLSVSAAATGQTTRVIPIALTITAIPAVKVAVSPTSVKIAPGGFAQVAVLLTRVGGLTGDLVMTAEGLPTGVTASFGPSPVIATVTTMTLSATAAAQTGLFNVVVKAAAGSDVGTATFPLTIGVATVRN